MVGENNASFHLGIVGCVLAGNDGYFPVVVPEQSDFGMYRSATVVEATCNYLERLGAYTPYPIVEYEFEGNYFIVFDMVLKLLDAFIRKGIGGHKQMDRTRLFNEVHNQAYQVKIAETVIVCI